MSNIFDFLYDPFGFKKRRDEMEIKVLVERLKHESKDFDEKLKRDMEKSMALNRQLLGIINEKNKA